MAKNDESETVNYATRLPSDKAAEVEEWRKSESLNKSEAIRTLVRRGLEAERSEVGVEVFLRVTFAAAGVLLFVATALTAAFAALLVVPPVLPVGLAVVTVAAVLLARTTGRFTAVITRVAGVSS